MGMFDTVWLTNKDGEDVDIQFKCGLNSLENYDIGDSISIDDGIYFDFNGCFVVFKGTVVAAYESEYNPLKNKRGGLIPYPDLHTI